MDCNYIRRKAHDVLIECDIKYFPINCFDILQHYGYRILTYSQLQNQNKELYEMCINYSEDAFRIGSKSIVAYNDKKPFSRVRFSLMHELGHHILEHISDLAENEVEANYFASNILAPRMAIYYSKCKTIFDIKNRFRLSTLASKYAAQDYIEWCWSIQSNGMSSPDKELYEHFYDENYGGFVYAISKCEFCGETVYNSDKPLCIGGCKPDFRSDTRTRNYILSAEDRRAIMRYENMYLYNV